jgi:putative endonuclease|tara:strand:+ start:660 stop:926 length:267 start_codon:yes stop_codon:yes gene_type:complete
MKYYVYLLVSNRKNNNKRIFSYVGYTSNLINRLKLHNSSKGAKFTKGKKWKIAYSKAYKEKPIAMKEEYKLKKNRKLRNKIKIKFNKI